ncbi:uncharacterized protein C8Q71DRAFT_905358 [Rhodofomes roseus]|uniref:Uncharacterized protein n=1 Tax=Rhodofomes roseus TaxID=34475 RepID=A0ABQ8KNI5_9APHY|nr:uncharacterized protein C8Q71DRAFT_905358 [Rhodofomes roseus]KAH9839987.1 hypothetical protein C8Q71DRAFT_905358 [Rhodofomes roseus]
MSDSELEVRRLRHNRVTGLGLCQPRIGSSGPLRCGACSLVCGVPPFGCVCSLVRFVWDALRRSGLARPSQTFSATISSLYLGSSAARIAPSRAQKQVKGQAPQSGLPQGLERAKGQVPEVEAASTCSNERRVKGAQEGHQELQRAKGQAPQEQQGEEDRLKGSKQRRVKRRKYYIDWSPNKAPPTGRDGLLRTRAGGSGGFALDHDDEDAGDVHEQVRLLRRAADILEEQQDLAEPRFIKNAMRATHGAVIVSPLKKISWTDRGAVF